MIAIPYRVFDELCPNSESSITIPKTLFRFLLSRLLMTMDFDEEDYIERNPDVASSLRRGEYLFAKDHYVNFGYFEGRADSRLTVSERYYALANPDVARALAVGTWASCAAHFEQRGVFEWRSPNQETSSDFEFWRSLLEVSESPASMSADTSKRYDIDDNDGQHGPLANGDQAHEVSEVPTGAYDSPLAF